VILAERAKAAHSNAVENLVMFAPLVFLCADAGIDADAPAFVYLIARLIHFPAEIMGPRLPMVRTLAFGLGWAMTIVMASMLIM